MAKISMWAQGIIISVIIATIIEMILPEGKNKKYIKIILGIYIMFAIISPIISKVSKKEALFAISNYEEYFKNTNTDTYVSEELKNINIENVEELFISNLNSDIRGKVVKKGYVVKNIETDVELENEETYGKIKRINLILSKDDKKTKNGIVVEKITIGEKGKDNKELELNEINNLKDYLSKEYELSIDLIHINAL